MSVFIVNNTRKGREIMTEWMNLYPKNKWSKNADGKWVCKVDDNTECEWSRNEYEQGAFNTNILERYKSHINHYDWRTLNHRCQNEGGDNDPAARVCHFSLNYKDTIPEYLSRNGHDVVRPEQQERWVNM